MKLKVPLKLVKWPQKCIVKSLAVHSILIFLCQIVILLSPMDKLIEPTARFSFTTNQ